MPSGRVVRTVGVALWLLPSLALAEPSAEDKALSTELFKEGRRLLGQGKVAEACAKLGESQRLVPATGTLLNLAICQEQQGKTATAYAAFVEARARAKRDRQAERVKLAEAHIAKLEPRLSHITISVAPDADLPELRVFRDGSEVGRGAWGTAMPVDPGEHTIEARAPGRQIWRRKVQVGATADAQSVSIAALEAAPEDSAPPEAQPVPVGPAAAPLLVSPTPREPNRPGATQRTAGLVMGGLGLIGVGAGTYFGLRAFSKWSDSDANCPNDRCTPAGAEAADQARSAADLSTLCIVVGATALGAGAFLYFSADSGARERRGLWLQPSVGRGGAKATVGARF